MNPAIDFRQRQFKGVAHALRCSYQVFRMSLSLRQRCSHPPQVNEMDLKCPEKQSGV
jgi:hypothetical protein